MDENSAITGSMDQHRHIIISTAQAIIQGDWLRLLREKTGLSKRALADILGISMATLNEWETRHDVRLRTSSAVKICSVHDQVTDILNHHQPDFSTLIPMSGAGMMYGRPQGLLQVQCSQDMIDCLDLGILGIWIAVPEAKVKGYRAALAFNHAKAAA